MTQLLVTMLYGFVPLSQQPSIPHGATHHNLCLPSILDYFNETEEDKATQDAMDTRVFWHRCQTIMCQATQVFINHKGYLPIILQGIINYQICFIYIFTG
ncbi:hypothetical protein Y1Q_0021791 [Alligator mississippiensis]|uniref:Uncharacterized protein n=1 Tax=Alligator mississippiensis TaxID=8496 RepID=A0A151PAX3_ALLMI|nr:hypothetical protein Y1Q_0021791 [Alligator mississippiensis]